MRHGNEGTCGVGCIGTFVRMVVVVVWYISLIITLARAKATQDTRVSR
jgi:hypothetical protein